MFKTDDNVNLNNKKSVDTKVASEDSDSDSDYEYFKVQKELEVANKKEDTEGEEEEAETATGNSFAEAVKTAIVEDELVLPATVNQTFLVVPMKLRLVTLCSLIVEHCVIKKKGGKMIVFMATLEMVDYFSELIECVLTGNDVKVKKKDGKTKKSKAKKRKAGGSDDEVIYKNY